MRVQIAKKLGLIYFMLTFTAFFFLSGEALPQKKGEFVKKDQLIDFSINLARSTIGYKEDSYTISISEIDGQIIVQFDPIQDYSSGSVKLDSELELYFKEVEGGYVYIGGLKG